MGTTDSKQGHTNWIIYDVDINIKTVSLSKFYLIQPSINWSVYDVKHKNLTWGNDAAGHKWHQTYKQLLWWGNSEKRSQINTIYILFIFRFVLFIHMK